MDLARDKLDYLICIAASKCYDDYAKEFDAIDTSNVAFSKSYESKKKRIIWQYKNKDRNNKIKKVAFRIAICAMLIMSIFFVTVMAVEPLREALFETVIEWYDDYFTIRFESPTSVPTSIGDSGLSETPTEPPVPVITPPTIIEEVRKPTYLPEGVEEEPVMETKAMVMTEYYLGDELYCSFSQKLLEEYDKYIDNEGAIIDEVNVGEYKATLATYDGKDDVYLFWTDGEYIYQLYTYFAPTDELIKIAESIK